jgi:hypothetical protein
LRGERYNMNKMPIVLQGAYGRRYSDPSIAAEDYFAGKDFRIIRGPYCSCRDFVGKTVSIKLDNGVYMEVCYNG